MNQLARRLHIAPEQIAVLSVVRATWPDTCLGLPAEGEICATVETPGFAIAVAAEGQRYEFRTDESGERIRLASAPLPETGEPLLTWRDSRSFDTLVIGTQRIAWGRRGRPLLGLPLALPERARQLQRFLARFAPFQNRTPAGEISLRGVGSMRATPAEQRMLAEWARLVATEAEKGLERPAEDNALVWRRTGGADGSCDLVTVGRAGFATASSCREPDEPPVATVALEPGELEQLYAWLDGFEAFSWSPPPDDTPGAIRVHLELDGMGVEPVRDDERERILAFVNTLVRRLVLKAPEAAGP